MKKHFALAAGLAALLSSGAAMGADINGSLKDGADVFSAPKEVIWSGFYIGGAIGYGNSNHNLTVHDYFKDYCSDDALNEGFNPFENSDRSKTLGNRKTTADANSDGADLYNTLNPSYDATKDTDGDGDEDASGSGYDHKYIKGAVDTKTWTKCEEIQRTNVNRGAGVDYGDSRTGPASASGGLLNVPGSSQEVGSLDGVNAHGVVGDVRLGYDRAFGRFLIGAWGSYGFNGMEAEDVNTLGLGNAKLEKQDEWAIGLRAGAIVAPRTLVYALAGWSHTSYDFSGIENISTGGGAGKAFSKETDFDGVVVGGGVEFALMSNVFLGLEYQHTFYGEEAIFDVYNKNTNVGGRIDDDLDEDKVMGTLKIKLNGGLFD